MVAKTAGSFLGGFFNNPGLVAISVIGIGLFIFRDKISDFVQKGFDSFKLPDINLPEIKFPDFPEFPTIPNPFEGFDLSKLFNQNVENPPVIIPGQGGNVPPELNCECGTVINQDSAGNVTTFCTACESQNVPIEDILPNQPVSIADFINRFTQTREQAQQEVQNFNVQTGIPDQTFQGGGLSFIGGSVSEIPIDRLSLGQIIDRFNVTASQAADIRARALDDFGGFDFGTNTGSGIGSAFPSEFNQGNVSNQGFQGLTAQEIALRLTGGNISNF